MHLEPYSSPRDADDPAQRIGLAGSLEDVDASWKKPDAPRLVLVIDDDRDILDVTRFVLESEGFRVETARNGAEALKLFRAGTLPDLVLLDLMMPVMNGWELLQELAKLPALASVPVLALTAGGSVEVPGVGEVLRKPIDLELLIDAVERHTRRAD